MSPRQRITPARASLALALLLAGAALAACSGGQKAAGPAAIDPESYADPLVRSQVRERALGMLEDAARGNDALLRANALEALIVAPGRVEPLARAGLHDQNLGVRFVAAMTIGRLALRDSAPFVRPLLADPSPMVRAAAIYALHRTGNEVDPTPLAQMLKDRDPRVRAQAAFVLGEMGNPSANGMLKDAAKDDLPRAPIAQVRIMRLQIAEALVKLGDSEAIETIRAALYPSRPEDFETAALAVQIIGQVGDRRSIDQLVILTAMKDQYKMPAEVRLAAAAALSQLGQARGSFIADEYWASEQPALRAQAAFVYGQTGREDSLGKLDSLLTDREGFVRVAAAAAAVRAVDRIAGVQSEPVMPAAARSAAGGGV